MNCAYTSDALRSHLSAICMYTAVPLLKTPFASCSQSLGESSRWLNCKPLAPISNESNMREVKNTPSPVCLLGSVVSFPFDNSNRAWRISGRLRAAAIFAKIPTPSSEMIRMNTSSFWLPQTKAESPAEWSIALFSISVKPRFTMFCTFGERLK